MDETDPSLASAAETAVTQCLGLEADESCVVVCDPGTEQVARALYDAAADVTDQLTYARYPTGSTHGSEPPAPIAGALETSDVFFAPTSKSLSHTRAREAACEAGARGATLPGITTEVFTTGLDADYDRIANTCERLRTALSAGSEIRVQTDRGTDLTIGTGDRSWLADTGIVHEPGGFSNLPAGEVFISPITADGTVIVDGTMRPHGLLETPIELTIEAGQLVDVSDPSIRETIEEAATSVGEAAYNVAELGVGANEGVTELVGSVLLDEKAAGTIHVAIGDDASIGGDTEAPIHLDGIVTSPTVTVDGEPIELPSSA